MLWCWIWQPFGSHLVVIGEDLGKSICSRRIGVIVSVRRDRFTGL